MLDVNWKWVRGHAGHPENEVADQMAGAAARAQTGQSIHLTAEQVRSGEFAATTSTGKPRAAVIEVDTELSDTEIAALVRGHLYASNGKAVRFRQAGA